MKVRYEATIPTGTYANIRPVVEFAEGEVMQDGSNIDTLFDKALDHFIHIAKTCSDNTVSVSRNVKKA